MSLSRRDLAVGAGSLAVIAAARAAAAPMSTDPSTLLAPEYRALTPLLLEMTALSPLTDANLAARRAVATSPPFLAAPLVQERQVRGGKGAPDVRVYVINADPKAAPKPAIVHMHGGGFVVGAAKDAVNGLQPLAAALDCVIVTVDYRLAPETRFPGALEDNYAGLKWLHDNATALGVDRDRIAVAGESAGGGHAAMLAIAARDRGEVPLVFQALTYPMLDDRTAIRHPAPPQLERFIWTPGDNRYGWSALLGRPAGSRRSPYGAVPARVDDLRGLPPAFIGVGSIDLFVDEDIEYARRLVAVGIPTELHVVPGAFHGFDVAPGDLSARFRDARLSVSSPEEPELVDSPGVTLARVFAESTPKRAT